MSLHEEIPPKEQSFSFSTVRVTDNKSIADQVKAFLDAGGKIDVVPSGVGKDSMPFNGGPDTKKQAEIQESFADNPKPKTVRDMVKKEIREAENKKLRTKPNLRPENRARSGIMNIHTLPNGKHVVTIKSIHIGTFEPDCLQDAIRVRDVERANMGLPKAEY